MNELADIITRWFDPETVGAFLLVGAAGFGKRSLDEYGLSIPLDHRALSLAMPTASK
jgi:hypothetical protein